MQARQGRVRPASGRVLLRPSEEVYQDQPWRCQGRSRDPGTPEDLCRCPSRKDHPGYTKSRYKNPVFILDEIDKLATSYAGDPASALLEVLDPEQNNTFSDHYLEVAYDLSDVLFIATANSLATIPAPLLDRMELIEISGYTKNEKFAIAKEHLLPEILTEHGLEADKVQVEDEAMKVIIEKYTREAGVRWLKKQLAKIARHVSEKIVSGKAELPFIVTPEMFPVSSARSRYGRKWHGKNQCPAS